MMLAKVKAFIRSNVYDLEPYPKLNSGVRLKFRDTPMRYILGLSPISRYLRSHARQERFFELFVNERVVEVPFVWRNLDLPLGAKVLDFGCNESLLPVQLASLGYDVSGVDLLHYAYRHPAFRFQQRNLVGAFQSEAFDGITSVSVVEHIGLGCYGEEVVARTTDVEVMEELYRILKTNGLLILTIPFGRKFTGSQYRVYDQKGVEELLSKFAVENVEFYRRSDKLYWMPCDHDEMKDLPSGEEPDNASRSVNGVMCIKARKR